jgi:large subunit ribosomal protein L18
MRNTTIKNSRQKVRRALRVRQNLHGTAEKPRLSVHKSNKHIQVQLIDDENRRTLGVIATFSKEMCNTEYNRRNKASAKKLGEKIAELAQAQQIKQVIFDRGPFKYHGILAELADAARAAGLQF